MEIRQNSKDSLYVLENGKLIAHLTTAHFLDEAEIKELIKLIEKVNQCVEKD